MNRIQRWLFERRVRRILRQTVSFDLEELVLITTAFQNARWRNGVMIVEI